MAEQTLGGNITLVDFNLDNQEMIILKKIIGNYAKKIRNITDYSELKIVMKTHKKTKAIKYEIKAKLAAGTSEANAETEGYNPFVAINEALRKIEGEIGHKIRK